MEHFRAVGTGEGESCTRRAFVRAAGASVGAAAVTGCMTNQATSSPMLAKRSGGVILFQGDSITDSGRSRKVTDANDPRALGTGYPLLVTSALLGRDGAGQWQCHNRGISGNRVPDLQARWEKDTVALAPDVLSILIGVNDYWHSRGGGYKG